MCLLCDASFLVFSSLVDEKTLHIQSAQLFTKILFQNKWQNNKKGTGWPRLSGELLLHPFNGLFSRTTWVSQHQKGTPFWILLEQEILGWQWHQLDHMQIICTSLQTDNHASTSPLRFLQDGCPSCQPTSSVIEALWTHKHWRHKFLQNKWQNNQEAEPVIYREWLGKMAYVWLLTVTCYLIVRWREPSGLWQRQRRHSMMTCLRGPTLTAMASLTGLRSKTFSSSPACRRWSLHTYGWFCCVEVCSFRFTTGTMLC